MKTILFILMLCLTNTVSGQSFYAHNTSTKGHDKQCHAVHNKKTLGQKLRNKIKYAKKRQDNQWFSERERRRDMKRRGFKI